MKEHTVNVAEYLFTRLRQLGCRALHGLPGDFSLRSLDFVEPCGLTWVGNANELNAGYAADAYARINGIGALSTTFGVGELSAVNAIAGSYAELVPVVHIVGSPAKGSRKEGRFMHHTLGNGDFNVFARIAKEITCAQADLQDAATAPGEIDRVLRACIIESRPVHIQLPTDMVEQQVPAYWLETPIDVTRLSSCAETAKFAVDVILQTLYAAKRPVLLIDGAAQRRRVLPEVHALIRKANIPVFVAPMGKGSIDEDLPNFIGVYAGEGSQPGVARALESSDMVVTIGPIQSDLNTHGFSYQISKLNRIDIHSDHVEAKYAKFERVYFKSLLGRLVQDLEPERLQLGATDIPRVSPLAVAPFETDPDAITHGYLWPRLSTFLREGDILVTEAGTSFIGHWMTKLPRNVTVVNQILWSSIGFGVGAAQGAALAAKEAGKGQRVICFEGDGSFQLTAQELSTIMRHDLDVTMFVIENDGYEIERWVHGSNESYNDIPKWRYSKMPEVFNPEGSHHRVKSWKISTRSELEALLQDREFAEGKGLQFVEMHMPRGDAPKSLRDFVARIKKEKAQQYGSSTRVNGR